MIWNVNFEDYSLDNAAFWRESHEFINSEIGEKIVVSLHKIKGEFDKELFSEGYRYLITSTNKIDNILSKEATYFDCKIVKDIFLFVFAKELHTALDIIVQVKEKVREKIEEVCF